MKATLKYGSHNVSKFIEIFNACDVRKLKYFDKARRIEVHMEIDRSKYPTDWVFDWFKEYEIKMSLINDISLIGFTINEITTNKLNLKNIHPIAVSMLDDRGMYTVECCSEIVN